MFLRPGTEALTIPHVSCHKRVLLQCFYHSFVDRDPKCKHREGLEEEGRGRGREIKGGREREIPKEQPILHALCSMIG